MLKLGNMSYFYAVISIVTEGTVVILNEIRTIRTPEKTTYHVNS